MLGRDDEVAVVGREHGTVGGGWLAGDVPAIPRPQLSARQLVGRQPIGERPGFPGSGQGVGRDGDRQGCSVAVKAREDGGLAGSADMDVDSPSIGASRVSRSPREESAGHLTQLNGTPTGRPVL